MGPAGLCESVWTVSCGVSHTHTHTRTYHLLRPLLLFVQSYFDNVAATSLQTEVQPLHQLSETKQTLSTQHVHLGL